MTNDEVERAMAAADEVALRAAQVKRCLRERQWGPVGPLAEEMADQVEDFRRVWADIRASVETGGRTAA